jgi:hypothetical protein
MFWDESNRLRVVYDQNSYQMQHYIYDAAGERTLKASSKIENVYENGQVESNNTTMGLYTTYVSPDGADMSPMARICLVTDSADLQPRWLGYIS